MEIVIYVLAAFRIDELLRDLHALISTPYYGVIW